MAGTGFTVKRTTDAALARIAEIIHEADLDDERFDAPEAPGLDVVLRGLSMIGDDEHTMTVTKPVFDGLCEYYRRSKPQVRHPLPQVQGSPRTPRAPS
ncbi:chromate resistance protein ChrB domain-containing protein [Streptomyces sp. NPDC093250]|uniref:chromate resistance protein ChrB domain-containing protein n=1 Tax=Streptomyces sp. NPDC093250 TaxID=3366036 RepID=UPI00381E9B19